MALLPQSDSAFTTLASSSANPGDAGTIAIGFASALASGAPAGPAGMAVSGGLQLAGIVKSLGGHPGPGKIYQADCEAAASYARAKGVSVVWDPKSWTMTGHCKVTGADAWNVALAIMKGKGDPRVCKTLIPTESGICPVVCSKAAAGPSQGSQCRMPNAQGKISGKSGAASCLTQPGNCAQVKQDTGVYIPTAHNPAPSLDDTAHIKAVLSQGGSLGDLSSDQKADLVTSPSLLFGAGTASIFGNLGLGNLSTSEKGLLLAIVGGVAATIIAAFIMDRV